MPYFAVVVERGPAWDWQLPMREQIQWSAHAQFMDALAGDGFILAGGPLGGEDDARRILHIVEASNEIAARERLTEDVWHRLGLLQIATIDPWTVLIGSLPSQTV
jgi:uncharacterized protein YciI